jgi:hypothetical protein
MDIRKFNLRCSHVRKKGHIVLSQSLIYVHTFPPLSPILFICLSNSVAKKVFLGKKYWGRGTLPPPPSLVTPMHAATVLRTDPLFTPHINLLARACLTSDECRVKLSNPKYTSSVYRTGVTLRDRITFT